MDKKRFFRLMCVLLSASACAYCQMIFYADPPRIDSMANGSTFRVDLRIRNGVGGLGWQGGFYYDKAILHADSAVHVDSFFRNSYGVGHGTYYDAGVVIDSLATPACVYAGGMQEIYPYLDSGGAGDALMMKVFFKVKAGGRCMLEVTQRSDWPGATPCMLLDTCIYVMSAICQDGYYGREHLSASTSKGICMASGNQIRPAVAWNSSGNEFLIVWESALTLGPYGNGDIIARRVSSTGDTLGSAINIENSVVFSGFSPSVSWNGTRYVVVFTYKGLSSWNYNIYVDTINALGAAGADRAVCNNVRYQGNPAIAWNGTYHFVVWEDARNHPRYPRIYGRRLNNAGDTTGLGSAVQISTNDIYTHQFPRVASNNSEFLVVWGEDGPSSNGNGVGSIRGQRVTSAGALVGSVINIGTEGAMPDVAWDNANNRYLVVYQKAVANNRWDIYGRIVKADGTMYTSEFVINSAAEDQSQPRVIFDSQTNRYVVIWVSEQSMPAIYKQVVRAAGTLLGSATLVTNANYQQTAAAVANASVNDAVVWQDLQNGTDFNIYGYASGNIGIAEGNGTGAASELNDVMVINPTLVTQDLTILLNLPPNESDYSLAIYDATGRSVKNLGHSSTYQPFGRIVWDKKDKNGSVVGAGVYFVQLRTDNLTITKKFVVSR